MLAPPESGAARADGSPRAAERIESLLASFDASTRAQAEDLVRTVLELYGEGLERVLTRVDDTLGEHSAKFFEELCEDKLVESLLCLHGLHPIAVEERVQNALDSVRPYLKSHAGGVDIARIDGDIVILRLEGTCDGCPSSSLTVKNAVERAILERVPEIREVRAEGAAAGSKLIDLTVLPLGV